MVSLQVGNPADLASLLARLCADLEALVAQLGRPQAGAPGGPALWAYTTERKAEKFRVIVANFQTANIPVQVLPRNPNRTDFKLQTPAAGSIYVGYQSFDPNQTGIINDSAFGLSGHIGEVWVAAATVPLSVTIVEQWDELP